MGIMSRTIGQRELLEPYGNVALPNQIFKDVTIRGGPESLSDS